ncbi:PREDICTED: transmembrane protein 126A isoform X2 [Drosophila arizonae]|uniref:Transmembrane protein 126A isoform X1 n=1 Tax=Drosophila arizonae TaxID=7263 RepID=A0ABM1NVP0_DROAR|nr:PREDICTED: transmembrane protein 126A isoform X1 [Drosophila arizonae]XP_017859028.1 PREDICTED: transmembrane protein 126A isoform X2 [Drosophila arizonae]
MALSRARPNELPTDAVIISEDHALRYQWKIITSWDKIGEVWSLRYAPGILSAMAAATGAYVNNHYRRRLRLGAHGRLSSYLPIVVVPAIFTMLTHKFFIQSPLLLRPLTECPVCTQVRSAAIQTALGVVYPTILAPFAAFMFASRCYTYRLPSITENPREVFMLYRKLTRPIIPAISTLIAIQAFITMYLTGKEETQNYNIMLRMKQIEQEVEEQHMPQRFDF